MAKSDGALGRIRKQLRSVLISEKYGVAVDRVEMDYQELVWSLKSWSVPLWFTGGWTSPNSQSGFPFHGVFASVTAGRLHSAPLRRTTCGDWGGSILGLRLQIFPPAKFLHVLSKKSVWAHYETPSATPDPRTLSHLAGEQIYKGKNCPILLKVNGS